jgi:hypothetical protein
MAFPDFCRTFYQVPLTPVDPGGDRSFGPDFQELVKENRQILRVCQQIFATNAGQAKKARVETVDERLPVVPLTQVLAKPPVEMRQRHAATVQRFLDPVVDVKQHVIAPPSPPSLFEPGGQNGFQDSAALALSPQEVQKGGIKVGRIMKIVHGPAPVRKDQPLSENDLFPQPELPPGRLVVFQVAQGIYLKGKRKEALQGTRTPGGEAPNLPACGNDAFVLALSLEAG